MIAYYNFTDALVTHLQADKEINTVVIGDLSQVDLNKQSIFGFAHILIGSASFPTMGVVRFAVTVSVMDVVDESKNDIKDIDKSERWKGVDDRQNVLNTMLGVIERLTLSLDGGALQDASFDLVDRGAAEPFEDRFENLLTGWSNTYTIDIINTVQNCSGLLFTEPIITVV
jgi:hypothetical protein